MITNLFLSVFNISISIGLIIALLLLITPFLNKRYASKWKYWIWIVLTLRLIIPIGWHDGMSIDNIQTQTETAATPESKKEPSNAPINEASPRRITIEIPTQITTPIIMPAQKNTKHLSILDIIAYVWMFGSLLFLSVHLLSYFFYKRQILKKGRVVKDHNILCLLQEQKQELHIKRTVPVMEYSKASSPMILGFSDPVLVLPTEQYRSEEMFFILKHELIHLKRGDIYFKLLFVIANAIHWFNPLIWIMQKEAAVDMELSCDEKVTQGADFATRKAYTETLLSTLHKQTARKTLLTTQFYGGKQIMKKRFKNILGKTRKKNGVVILICATILAVTVGTLVGCSISKTNTKDAPDQSETEDIQPIDIQVENAPIDASSLESDDHSNQADHSSANDSSPESDNHSAATDQPLNDCSITIGDVSLSLSESKQDILAKLEAAGFDYSEVQPYSPDEASYDLYYNAAGCLQIYFLDDTCVRIRLQELDDSLGNPQTARGLHPGDTYSQMIERYGDDYETHAYSYKGIYTIYRYSIGDCICEFGIAGENRDSFYNIDIYLPSQLPIYDYGEELTE